MKKSIDYYIALSQKSSTDINLNYIIGKIQEVGFDHLDPSEYMFLIKVYYGKIASLSEDKTLFTSKVDNILRLHHLDIEDYSNNNMATVWDNARDVARILINMYKQEKSKNEHK